MSCYCQCAVQSGPHEAHVSVYLLQSLVFEINDSARWFYGWEVGATRERRFKEHVFEAYVFYDPNARRQAQQKRSGQVQPPPTQVSLTWRVLARVCSTRFTLVSSRRAPLESRGEAGDAMADMDELNQRHIESLSLSAEWGDSPSSSSPRTSVGFGQEEEEEEPLISPLAFTTTPIQAFTASSSSSTRPTKAEAPELTPASAPVHRSPRRLTTSSFVHPSVSNLRSSSFIQSASTDLAIMRSFLDRIPLTNLLPYLDRVESSYLDLLGDQLKNASLLDRIRLRRRQTSTALLVSKLATSTANLSPFGGLFSNSRDPKARAATQTLMQQATMLAVWLFFDGTLGEQIEQFMQRSARVVLDKATLYRSYDTYLEWLHAQVDSELARRDCSLDQLVYGIKHFWVENQWSDESFMTGTMGTDIRPLNAFSRQSFIAQVREAYFSAAPLKPKAKRAQHRLHPFQLELHSSLDASPQPWVACSGAWLCDLADVQARSIEPPNQQQRTSNASAAAPSLTQLLWFWRQLSCISLTFACDNDVPTLVLTSAFNRALTDNQVLRVVFDNQHHWFRCFPAGESTIGVTLCGQSFGDYVAQLTRSEMLLRTYSWPLISNAWAYCWNWTLVMPTDDGRFCVRLRVDRGRFRRPQEVVVNPDGSGASLPLEMESLSCKLARIGAWEPTYELQLVYMRL